MSPHPTSLLLATVHLPLHGPRPLPVLARTPPHAQPGRDTSCHHFLTGTAPDSGGPACTWVAVGSLFTSAAIQRPTRRPASTCP